jgi:chromate reductase
LNPPPKVVGLKAKVRAADSILFVTPEYNYSIPRGTAGAQYHLRQSFLFLNMYPLNRPEVMIANAATKFDEHGNFRDEKARELIRELSTSLVEWTRLLRDL